VEAKWVSTVGRADGRNADIVHELRELGDVLLDAEDLLVAFLGFPVGHPRFLVAI
jgi:hypothetical protein